MVLYYGELFEALGLAALVVVGHSFGAMVAAELAAASPKQVGRLVLIDPLGLWRDDLPVKNWMLVSEQARRPLLFADPAGEAAMAFFDAPAQSEKRGELLAAFIWAQACTGKFIWPIPERGFENRSHRITAPSLVIWANPTGLSHPITHRTLLGRSSAPESSTLTMQVTWRISNEAKPRPILPSHFRVAEAPGKRLFRARNFAKQEALKLTSIHGHHWRGRR